MNSFDVRKKFLEFFEQKGHTVVPSSSLIPAEDPTLLFANAGMNQFKDVFLGKEKRSYTTATTSQKCVRAGGKHNDLDMVGFTERHLTFFEMLGNFSFGDYFKKEAIPMAWELLTKGYGLPEEKLFITVFRTDDESYDIWHKDVGIPKERIFRLDEADNFWSMGDTGPCGPCTEIYYDRGPEHQGPYKQASPGSESPRYMEVWNLVFMQYNRDADGNQTPLKQTGVDTGVGLERLCMVLQGKNNLYQIDMFKALIEEIEKLSGKKYVESSPELQAAFHVLCDHVRSTSLLIADGCSPSNDGRGYVLRKIIRRAALFTQKLTNDQNLLVKLSRKFIQDMHSVFSNLKEQEKLILKVLESEIDRFSTNLVQGRNILDKYIAGNTKKQSTVISGEQAFKLYDTYGFPIELTILMASEQKFSVDMQGFEAEMKKQQEQSGKKTGNGEEEFIMTENLVTEFVGYETMDDESEVQFVSPADDGVWIITKRSPFFVECGGQVDDKGYVEVNGTKLTVVGLKKTGQTFKPAIAIKLAAPKDQSIPEIAVGQSVRSVVNETHRWDTVRNHTATHLLQAALIEVLGPQVKQAGSLVHPDYLRFDFSHHEAMTEDQIKKVEDLVNAKVQAAISTNIFHTTLKDAKDKGIISFFGEKYNPDEVRVVEIPGFSAELCGGTHAPNTGIIGTFKITSETALATGVRRMVALTGRKAMSLFQETFATSKALSETFKVKTHEVLGAVKRLNNNYGEALTQIKQLKKQMVQFQVPAWKDEVQTVGDVPFLFKTLDGASNDDIKSIISVLEKIVPGLYFFANKLEGRVGFAAYAGKNVEGKINLKTLGAHLKETCGLKGGGNNKQIQGGGASLPDNLEEVVKTWITSQQ